jgi:hypothetical protein
MTGIASFHLVRDQRGLGALARLATDRRPLRHVPGLAFWRLLGTGRGSNTAASINVRRTALFAVWEREDDLDRFLRSSAIADRWMRAEEAWHVRLRAISGHGSWRGFDVLPALQVGSDGGPIAVITRASVRMRAWPAFTRDGSIVSADLQRADGLLGALGMGEAPVGRLGTFSLWRRADDIVAFARSLRHADVMRRSRHEGWYREELFARFEPYASAGTWDGVDPLQP